jgi:hypothetical protein
VLCCVVLESNKRLATFIVLFVQLAIDTLMKSKKEWMVRKKSVSSVVPSEYEARGPIGGTRETNFIGANGFLAYRVTSDNHRKKSIAWLSRVINLYSLEQTMSNLLTTSRGHHTSR